MVIRSAESESPASLINSRCRREESSKHKLSDCLLACMYVRTSLIGWIPT